MRTRCAPDRAPPRPKNGCSPPADAPFSGAPPPFSDAKCRRRRFLRAMCGSVSGAKLCAQVQAQDFTRNYYVICYYKFSSPARTPLPKRKQFHRYILSDRCTHVYSLGTGFRPNPPFFSHRKRIPAEQSQGFSVKRNSIRPDPKNLSKHAEPSFRPSLWEKLCNFQCQKPSFPIKDFTKNAP